MDKQLSNENWINKISCLLHYMTDFLSQSPSSKTSHGHRAGEKDSSLTQQREKERPPISLANIPTHGPGPLPHSRDDTLCRDGQMVGCAGTLHGLPVLDCLFPLLGHIPAAVAPPTLLSATVDKRPTPGWPMGPFRRTHRAEKSSLHGNIQWKKFRGGKRRIWELGTDRREGKELPGNPWRLVLSCLVKCQEHDGGNGRLLRPRQTHRAPPPNPSPHC